MNDIEIDDIVLAERAPDKPSPDHLALLAGTLGVTCTVILFALLPTLAKAAAPVPAPGSNAPFEYVEARLLKSGEVKNKEALPDREVPALPTAPEEIIALDKDEQKPPPPPKTEEPEERQADAVDDDQLRQVFEKARAFAEIQDDYVPEGHPDGVPDGDVTDPAMASMGATYGRRLTKFIKERWIIPTLIGESERKQLHVQVTIRFSAEMSIIDYEVTRPSGNTLFDDSVKNAISRTQKEVKHLPEPPQSIAAHIYGGGISLTLHGADAPNTINKSGTDLVY